MALDEIKLDDLTWDGLVTASRRRIGAASDGRWTLHAPVDPGVTLVELYAWLLEQRVYWLDQVPDALVHASLALLRERARAARAAGTALQFRPADFAPVPRDTAMVMAGPATAPVVFSTTSEVTLLPLANEPLGLEIGPADGPGADRTADLDQGRVLRLFPADGSAAWVKLTLPLATPPPTVPSPGTPPITLLFVLDVTGAVPPQWDPQAPASVPPPAALTWWYRSAVDAEPVPWPEAVEDGTGGLRRSGVVQLALPPDWRPEPPTAGAGPGAAPRYAVWLRTDRATFSYPPRIVSLTPNVALARHARHTIEHRLRLQWLPLPGNRIPLATLSSGPAAPGVMDNPPLEDTVSIRLKERDGQWHRWTRATTLAWAGPADRRFVACRERGGIYFGDGVRGRLPVLAPLAGAADYNAAVRYRVGGGASGNVGESRNWERLAPGSDLTAINVVPAIGGEEAEKPADARERAAANMRRTDRAVTRPDYEAVAREAAPGIAIARARAAVGFHPGFPCGVVPGAVTVFVVPDAPRDESDGVNRESAFVGAPVPDPGALAAVRRAMERARLLATEVYVMPPRYRPVDLTVRLGGGTADVRTRLAERFRALLDPLRGGTDGTGRPFGETLSPSVLLRTAQQAVGDAGSVEWVGIRLGDSSPGIESCREVPIGPHDLAFLRDLHVEFGSSASTGEGGLQ